ncbi:MAG: flagellar biosynthetic protein FliO [Methylophaga sp.]|nr:flagellar biosynthetic protein FliO [Methylophaga sp.]
MKSLLFIFCGLPMLAVAETAQRETLGVDAGNLLQTLLGLLLVLALIVAMAWLVKRSQQLHGMGQQQFKVIAALPLGPREKAVLLQVGEQQFLLGVTPQNINLLSALEQPLDLNAGQQSPVFADKLKQFMQPRGK